MMDKPISFFAFEMLYWCGICEEELLALTAADFDFEKETVKINKSYQRLHGEDVITTPKTKKSNRTIKMPKFLCEEMQEYLGKLYRLKKKDRIFTVMKSYLHLLQGKTSWILEQADRQESVLRGESLSLHFPKVLFNTGQMMW